MYSCMAEDSRTNDPIVNRDYNITWSRKSKSVNELERCGISKIKARKEWEGLIHPIREYLLYGKVKVRLAVPKCTEDSAQYSGYTGQLE